MGKTLSNAATTAIGQGMTRSLTPASLHGLEEGDALLGLPPDGPVLFTEHDMDVVFRFASRIIVMVSGRILMEGTPAEISSNEKVREVYLGSGHG